MKRRRIFSSLLLLMLAVLGAPAMFPRAHAQSVGTVCISDPFSTNCPSSPVAISAVNGTRMELAVNIQASDPLNGFDITVKADPTILDSINVNFTDSVMGQNIFVVAKCLGNSGFGCTQGQNGIGSIRVAAVALGLVTPVSTTGRLFSIVFNVTSTSSSVFAGFQTGCSGTSTPSNYCVTIVNGYTINRETIQESSGQPGDFSILADFCCSSVGRSATIFGQVLIQSLNGFFGSMSLTFTVSPFRRQGPFVYPYTTESVLLLPNTSTRFFTVLTTNSFTQSGNYTVTIRGKAGELVRTGTASIQVITNSTAPPNPPPTSILQNNPNMVNGFNGLDNRVQRLAGSGVYNNTEFQHEPPDQALCVGSGFVVEAVNTVVETYDATGTALTPPTPLSQFFKLSPEVSPGPPRVLGNIISDPKCYYDNPTGRFFLTALQIDVNATSGVLGRAHVELAVSETSDPRSLWNLYAIDDTNDGKNGTQTHFGCPCFGDQPLIGADENGFYVSTNEFSLHPFGAFNNGAQVYAMSKASLENGTLPTIVEINAGAIPTPAQDGPGTRWSSLQPATTPGTVNNYDRRLGGTEYLLSSLDFNGTVDNRIALWALTNTQTLNTPSPSLQVALQVITTEIYALPNPAIQKQGPAPLGTSLVEPLLLVDSNDDRMNQVVYSNGLLWSAVNTGVTRQNVDTVGIAWFILSPKVKSLGTVEGSILNQGYIAPEGDSVMFPAIGVTSNRNAVIVYTLVGPDYYPSAAYSILTLKGIDGVHVAAAGSSPADGFSGYPETGGNGIARWGDYSAAVGDTKGQVWIATEYIPDTPRTTFANWGTFIGQINIG